MFADDRWELADILRASDRRIGTRRLAWLYEQTTSDAARSVIAARLSGNFDFDVAFIAWLERNRNRFRYQPRIHKTDSSLILMFEGCTDAIQWHLRYTPTYITSEIQVFFDGECWDHLFESDVSLGIDADGQYYCELCLERERKKYSSLERLLIEHTLESTLAWLNEHLTPDHVLWLCGYKDRWTSARVLRRGEKPANDRHGVELIFQLN